ncbi:MAG: 3-deoxy-D-manno-octulosonic acid transferase [Bacteroidia bacterium]|nr:3-deoxy-D-manno-octulosonic acid transferase [Bacteroidia bacterium]
MKLIYLIAVKFYGFVVMIASLWNPKASGFINGRKGIFKRISEEIPENEKIIWVHCSSLGEYEQGKPLMKKLKENFADHKIFLTLFSPSGYENLKGRSVADYLYYLPLDSPANARRLVKWLNPKMAILVKYEYWYFYLSELKKQKIPIYVVSAVFRYHLTYFKWYGSFFRKMLAMVDHFFVQDKESQNILYDNQLTDVSISGDTRFDTVWNNSINTKQLPIIDNFCDKNQVLVAGSTWPEDDKLLCKLISENGRNFKMVIAPHEISESHLKFIESHCPLPSIRYSAVNPEVSQIDERVLIIDNIGILSSVYARGTVSYIGGGFGKGIHNVLEAAVFGTPIIFGPNYKFFREAGELVKLKGAFSIKNYQQLAERIDDLFESPSLTREIHKINTEYIKRNKGASEVIINYLLINS